MNYVYMLRCSDGTLYTGWTNDLEKRVKCHNSGKGAKYTSCRRPVELVYHEEYDEKREAQSREYYLKKLSRKEKLTLIDIYKLKNFQQREYEKEGNEELSVV